MTRAEAIMKARNEGYQAGMESAAVIAESYFKTELILTGGALLIAKAIRSASNKVKL